MTLLLPDLFAMAILLGVLALVRRRYPHHDIRLWVYGLLLVLLECAARIIYGLHLPLSVHRAAHAVALNAYFLAGVLFLRSSVQNLRRMPRSGLYVWLNTVPGIVLLTIYAYDVRRQSIYVPLLLAGIAVSVVTTLLLRRRLTYFFGLLVIWVPCSCAIFLHNPRVGVYLALASLYLTIAGAFAATLPKGSSGKIAVVTGFVLWAACFATHPWIAEAHPDWNAFASEIWNMQKFLITVGFLLVLFEKQVNSSEWLALHDQLTGLPNRRLFQDRLGNALARADRDRTAVLLFCLDLNNFKSINDTLGHDAGDMVLRTVAARLDNAVRRTDTLARIGGDEFVLIASDFETPRSRLKVQDRQRTQPGTATGFDTSADARSPQEIERAVASAALRIEENLRAAGNRPVTVAGARDGSEAAGHVATLDLSLSIGRVVYPDDARNVEELMRLVDTRMYADKRRQKNAAARHDVSTHEVPA